MRIQVFNTSFYPRSPCGERRVTVLGIQHRVGVSIHALLAESDVISDAPSSAPYAVSIHALLAESDNNINSSVTTADKVSIHALLAESDRYCIY